jgi:hypothetical protein
MKNGVKYINHLSCIGHYLFLDYNSFELGSLKLFMDEKMFMFVSCYKLL